ncbi:hypothetical protein [Chryseobacterium kwangjuense]|nr:hypothetical protein [Chryseobacterium kwangjuense]
MIRIQFPLQYGKNDTHFSRFIKIPSFTSLPRNEEDEHHMTIRILNDAEN